MYQRKISQLQKNKNREITPKNNLKFKIMKKIILSAISFAFLASLIFISCNKNQIKQTSSNLSNQTKQTRSVSELTTNGITISSIDNVLSFSSISDYESIVNSENRQTLINFASDIENSGIISNYYSTVNGEEKQQFEFLGKLLNTQGIIKIGEFLILIDFTNEKVFAKSDGSVSELLSAKEGTVIPNVLTFDIKDDVIEELKIKKTRGLFCNDKYSTNHPSINKAGIATNLISSQFVNPADLNQGTIDINVAVNGEVKYWPAGIYFELNSRIVVTPAGVPLATAPFSYTTVWTWKRRCGTNGGNSSTSAFLNASNDKTVCYWNVRALTSYDIKETFSSTASVPSGVSKTIHVID
ncbi:MAG: hypothetical protein RLZZ118_1954 [Bacteroidota bacterium]|jgi:hypothetical protein